MILRQDLVKYLNDLLQSHLVSDYCPNGLQVQGKEKIKTIATAVSANLETIQKAVEHKVDVLIVHHGLFWTGDSFEIVGTKQEKISLLLKHDISLLAYHLPLDMHPTFGNNWKAALDLGWTDLKPFGKHKGLEIGVAGRIKPISRNTLQTQLEKYYQHPAQTAFGGKEKIETLALISGGSHRSLLEAATAGFDAFITGSFDEPTWNQAYEEKMNFFALGHSATERIGPKALGEHLAKQFKISHRFIDVYNPF